MSVGAAEIAKFSFGIFLMVLSGYLWSLAIFKKMRITERIVFGFAFTLSICTFVVMLFSLWMKVTDFFFTTLFIIYAVAPIPIISMKRRDLLSIPIPEKKQIVKAVILAGILIFIFYMAFLPHSVKNYELPFHADEWVHWGYTRGFMDYGELKFPNPFTGNGWADDPEVGFHVFLASFKWLSGAELKTIFLLMPSMLAVFVGLTAFSIGERNEKKFGLWSAFFVAFIPTSNRFLGPSFLVPLSLGLFLTLISLMLVQLKGNKKYPLLIFILSFTALAHPPSAAAMAIVLILYIVSLVAERRYREGILTAVTVAIPLLLAYFIMPAYFEMGVNSLFGEKYVSTLSMVDVGSYMGHLGYIVIALFFFASFMAIYKGKSLQRSMFLSALSFISIIFLYDRYKFGLSILYDRSFAYLFMFMTILAGYGLSWVKYYGEKLLEHVKKSGRLLHSQKAVKITAIAIPVILCLTNAFFAVPAHRDEPYYKVISEDNFDAFEWIRNNIGSYRDDYHSFDKAAITPLKAVAFSSVTGVHTICSNFLPRYGTNIEDEMKKFLSDEGKDTDFLEKYDLSIVYGNCKNENLSEVYSNVYLYYGVPPEADFIFSREGNEVLFTDNSTTPYGEIINHTWNFGDGNASYGKVDGIDFMEGNARVKMKMNGSFSIDMWIQPHFSYNDGKTHEWFRWGGGGTYVVCYKHPNDRVYFVVKGEKWKGVSSTIKFDENEWHHFAATYNGWRGTFSLYWDGKIMEVKGGGGKLSSEEGTVAIGGVNNRWFDGCIRDVKIYGRMLSAQEVEGNYNGNVTTDGLQSWWKFNEGKGNVAHDSIGKHDATIYGVSKWVNIAEHAYSKPGEYNVTLTVMNEDGLTDSISKKINVS